MSSSVRSIALFISGLYIGKYFPQYTPLPHINRESIQRALEWLEKKQKEVNDV